MCRSNRIFKMCEVGSISCLLSTMRRGAGQPALKNETKSLSTEVFDVFTRGPMMERGELKSSS
ncbi:hypothetical protein J6590_012682 [Homalodisca vitripennis]|nr:hypothetical protein J6590_012682 [Homalodisca vitripennis]